MSSSLSPQELNDLYQALSPEERDELLRVLLYAASIGGDTVIQRLEEYLSQPARQRFPGKSSEQSPSPVPTF
jgi:hypothetical protein